MSNNKTLYILSITAVTCAIGAIALAKSATKSNGSPQCTSAHGEHICMVYNYSESKVWSVRDKKAWKDQSKEERSAQFPSTLPGDNGAKYNVGAAGNAFSPFSITYKTGNSGCKFTFSAATQNGKAAANGYHITSEGLGDYNNDACQVDGAFLIIK